MTKEGDCGIFSGPTAGNKMQYWIHLVSFTVTELQKDPSSIVYPTEKLFWICILLISNPQNNYSFTIVCSSQALLDCLIPHQSDRTQKI